MSLAITVPPGLSIRSSSAAISSSFSARSISSRKRAVGLSVRPSPKRLSSPRVVSGPDSSSIRIFGPESPSTTLSSRGPPPNPGRLIVTQPVVATAIPSAIAASVLDTRPPKQKRGAGRVPDPALRGASHPPVRDATGRCLVHSPVVMGSTPKRARSAAAARGSAVRTLVTGAVAHGDAAAFGAGRRVRLVHEGAALARGQIAGATRDRDAPELLETRHLGLGLLLVRHQRLVVEEAVAEEIGRASYRDRVDG